MRWWVQGGAFPAFVSFTGPEELVAVGMFSLNHSFKRDDKRGRELNAQQQVNKQCVNSCWWVFFAIKSQF